MTDQLYAMLIEAEEDEHDHEHEHDHDHDCEESKQTFIS
jgi:hypothetical protein